MNCQNLAVLSVRQVYNFYIFLIIDIINLMFKRLSEKFLDLIYKKKCLICSCSKTDNLLCKTCAKDVNYLSFFPHKIYNSCEIHSACLYENVIKKLICLLKFSHKKKVSVILAQILHNYYKNLNINKDFVVIYPDSYMFKNLTRGYEHMYLIAKEFCLLSKLKLLKHAIKKVKITLPQYKAKNRKDNIKDSFKLNKKYIDTLKNSPVLILDDIITSGATVEEIINLLQKEGINDITVLTVSKAKNW